ncbi:MAG: hypothetical protein IPM52_02160 [Bacteroidetes bacterium]|nr:hypothetical protein [Bacteroidota bacterium]
MIRKERKDKMFLLVEQWEQSGQSQRSFAMANGMKLYTFRYWVNKYRSKEQATGAFVQLNVTLRPRACCLLFRIFYWE